MNRRIISSYASIAVIALTLATAACKNSSKKSDSGDATSTPSLDAGYITISVDSAYGSTLYVARNTPVTWNFTASSTDGQPVSITRIVVNGTKPTGMTLATTSVSFTPSSETDLNGSLTVYAIKTGYAEQSQQFYWSQDPTAATAGSCTKELFNQALNMVLTQNIDATGLPTVLEACKASVAEFIAKIFNK